MLHDLRPHHTSRRLSTVILLLAFYFCFAPSALAQLSALDTFDPPDVGDICGIAVDTDSQDVFVYPCFRNDIHVFSSDGTPIRTIPRPGEGANDVDLQVAPEDLIMNGTTIPRGSILFVNGQQGTADIYALDQASGVVLETLVTDFGNMVIGGAYNPARETFFLLGDGQELIAEIDPMSGVTLATHDVAEYVEVFFGDLEVSQANGNLFVVSNANDVILEFTPDGSFEREYTAPVEFDQLSGIGLDCTRGEAWLSEKSGAIWRFGGLDCGVQLTLNAGGTCAADVIDFSWPPVSGAADFRLDVASAPQPDRILESVALGNVTEHAFDTASLAEGRRYYARVAASVDGGATYSEVSDFTDGIFVDRTAPKVQPPVAKLFPKFSNIQFSLFAEDAGEPAEYHLQIASTPDFANPIVDEDLGGAASFLYNGSPGETVFARVFAEDCAGNQSDYSATTEITIPHLPDLIVQDVQAPVSANSGQNVEITWTVANTGDEGTDAPKWLDGVYLHDEPTFDPGPAFPLQTVRNLSYLGAGESYTQTATITMPRGIEGTWYIFVMTDENRRQNESDDANNVQASAGFEVTRSPFADLQVVEILAPDNVFSGDTIELTWTVENLGTSPTDVDTWFDSVYLSEDDVFDFNFTNEEGVIRINDPALTKVEHTGVIEPGEQYPTSIQVTLPDDAIGDYHLFVAADVDVADKVRTQGAVYEFNQELDNWLGEPIGITLTPPPDLVVTSVQPPADVLSGETIDLVWTVENQGPGATRSSTWSDIVYYSSEPEFNPETAVVLGTFSHEGVLQNDALYTGSGFVEVPDGADGDGYFFVHTDWGEVVFEHTFDENNQTVSEQPAQVTRSPYPDITVADVTLSPSNATAGQQVALRYSVSNTGDSDAGPWTDSLFVSAESSWDRSEARAVAALPHDSGLSKGATRTRSATVTIPTDLEGTYYFYVVADAAERLFEYPDTGGNVTHSGAVSVLSYPPVDLTATLEAVPVSVSSGETVSIRVRVDNVGSGRTRSDQWTDAILLSTDNVSILKPGQDLNDSLLLFVEHEGSVAGGASYLIERDVVIPDGISGDYYMIAFPDVCDITEATACREVAEVDETNNAAAALIAVTLSPPSDLQVTGVTAPADLQASQPVTIEWTVENLGAGETDGDEWYDAIYLSRDPELSSSDESLTFRKKPGRIKSDESYVGNAEVQIPAFASGTWYVLVQTDSRDDIYEHLAENNNVNATRVTVTLPPATDLIVTDVTAPAQATLGEEMLVNWTLENAGSHPASGVIREGVFVSTDTEWDPTDPLLGVVERTIDLAPGESAQMQGKADLGRTYAVDQSGEITGILPGVPPGDYFVIVRTDIGGHIRETDTANNATASSTSTATDIPSLSIGETENLLLSTGESRYYRIDVPTADEDIVFSIDQSSDSPGSAALFLRKDAPPTSSVFDERSFVPFETDHSIVVSDADEGTYYLLIRADNLASPDTEFSVSARLLEFSVTEVYPAYGGNTGTVTVRLDGSKFEEGGQIFLENADGVRLQAFEAYTQNSTTAIAVFNLREEAIGLRDVIYVAQDGSEAVLEAGFDVVPGAGGAQMYVETSYPDAVRNCGTINVEITIGNRGTVNANDMFLLFGASGIIESSGPVIPCSDGMDFFDTAPTPLTSTQIPSQLEVQHYNRGGAKSVLPYWIYEVAPGQEMTFTVQVLHPVPQGSVSHFADIVFMPESEFTNSGALEDVQASIGYELLLEATRTIYNTSAALVAGKGMGDADEAEKYIRDGVEDIAWSRRPVGPKKTKISGGFVVGAILFGGGILIATEALIIGAPIAAVGALIAGIYWRGNGLSSAIDSFKAACSVAFEDFNYEGSRKRGASQPRGPTTETCSDGDTEVKLAVDPNDIVGPGSFGDANWVRASRTLPYTIRFENDPELASAPAQVVDIRHPLDPTIDERTFRLGSFGFANMTFDPPDNVSYYRERLDLSDSLGVLVDVTAGIDVTNREAFWIFQSLDPQSGTQPFNDPFAGFLPVNDSTGVGEGFVGYRARPVTDAPTGDEIVARADIVFDNNAPIETPELVNTLDADAPSSLADPEQTERDSTSVELTWSGSDIGSGVGSFAIYVSEDGGDFQLHEAAVTDTTYLFVGESGHSYRFFTLATDNVGNSEPLKVDGTVIDISSEVAAGQDLPETFELHQNYPNPFNPTTTIPFDLPQLADVEIAVYDVLGRRVMHLARETLQPGRHQQRLDMSGYASGVYFYELRARGEGGARFREVQNFVLVK